MPKQFNIFGKLQFLSLATYSQNITGEKDADTGNVACLQENDYVCERMFFNTKICAHFDALKCI